VQHSLSMQGICIRLPACCLGSPGSCSKAYFKTGIRGMCNREYITMPVLFYNARGPIEWHGSLCQQKHL